MRRGPGNRLPQRAASRERVTIHDVASEAGVSVATVSRTLSGSRPVSPQAARAVLAATVKLDYRANYLARALRSQATLTVGMVVPQIANPFFPGLVQSVERSLHAHGRALFLCDSEDDPDREANRIDALLNRQVDGLVIIPCDFEGSADAVKEASHRVPVVQLDRHTVRSGVDCVSVDNASGINSMLMHLEGTRKRLAFVGADTVMSTARERLDAYIAGSGRLDPSNPGRVMLGDFSLDWGREAASSLHTDGQLPDAVVCANDLIAMGVAQRLRSLGVRIPEDVAVSGFDDIGFAEVCEPSLTSVRQPVAELGAESVRLLLARLSGLRGSQQHVRFTPQLIVRSSTRAASHD